MILKMTRTEEAMKRMGMGMGMVMTMALVPLRANDAH
jgi:hypothetical protein